MHGTWKVTGGGGLGAGGGGGGGFAGFAVVVVAVVFACAAAVAVAKAVAPALAELVLIVAIVLGSLVCLAVAGLLALAGVRVWRWHLNHPVRQHVPAPPPWRAEVTATQPRPLDSEPPPAIEQHVHLLGVTAEDVAEVVRRQHDERS